MSRLYLKIKKPKLGQQLVSMTMFVSITTLCSITNNLQNFQCGKSFILNFEDRSSSYLLFVYIFLQPLP